MKIEEDDDGREVWGPSHTSVQQINSSIQSNPPPPTAL